MSAEQEAICARCRRPNPEHESGSLPSDWEVLTDGGGAILGVLCPGCMTAAESTAVEAEMDQVDREANRTDKEG